jgi:methionine-gamma-lyase
MSGCGGLLSFELAGGAAEAAAVAERLALFHLAPSLGGVHSLVVPPAAMLAGVLDESALDGAGARPGLVRLAVGLEHEDDLAHDLLQALGHARGRPS